MIANRLAVRVSLVTLLTIIALAIIVFCVELVALYHDERRRVRDSLEQLAGSVAPGAARAAYHVDQVQAAAILAGVMRSPAARDARIATELGEELAQRRRMSPPSIWDPVSEALFGDIVQASERLTVSQAELAGAPNQPAPNQPAAGAAGLIEVGRLELSLSPHVIGRAFFGTLGIVLWTLVLELLIVGAVLFFVFHRNVTAPLSRVGDAIAKLSIGKEDGGRLSGQLYCRDDELGLIIVRTNEMIARLEEQQKELMHREKVASLGSLLTGLAHEVNNPLAITIAQAELLKETATTEPVRQRADKILSPAKRCARIIHNFLAMARNREMEVETVHPRELIDEAVALLDFKLVKDNVGVTVVVDDAAPAFRADAAQVCQALLNLLINAQQAISSAEGERRIEISAALDGPAGDSVRLAVADTGPGVPPALRDKVLQPFFTTKKVGEGTGLGLSYVNSVVQSHGGSLTISDAALGGAEVALTLPTAGPPDTKRAAAPAPASVAPSHA